GGLSQYLSHDLGDFSSQLEMFAGVEMEAVYRAGDDDLTGVEEVAAQFRGDLAIMARQPAGFFFRAGERFCLWLAFKRREWRRAHQQHARRAAVDARHAVLYDLHQRARAASDV